MAVMHRLEALRILKAKLGSVEESRHAELSENEDLREAIDAKRGTKFRSQPNNSMGEPTVSSVTSALVTDTERVGFVLNDDRLRRAARQSATEKMQIPCEESHANGHKLQAR